MTVCSVQISFYILLFCFFFFTIFLWQQKQQRMTTQRTSHRILQIQLNTLLITMRLFIISINSLSIWFPQNSRSQSRTKGDVDVRFLNYCQDLHEIKENEPLKCMSLIKYQWVECLDPLVSTAAAPLLRPNLHQMTVILQSQLYPHNVCLH